MPPMPPNNMPMPPTGPQGDISGLQNLTRDELIELDSLLTPRLAQLLVKAFPWAREPLAPLLMDDMQGQGESQQPEQPGEMMQGGATPGSPIPRPMSPLARVGR